MHTMHLLDLPPETLLRILSYLDVPDLAALLRVSQTFRALASDPVLHHYRLRVVAPSRVSHALFGQTPPRPTVGELVYRGVMRGLGIERRWRAGLYFYTSLSVTQYESSLRLQRKRTSTVLTHHLRRLSPSPLAALYTAHVLPDVEATRARVSRALLGPMRSLKWSIQRDMLAKGFRDSSDVGVAKWLEGKGRGLVRESERLRLAVCPDGRKLRSFWEALSVAR